MMQPVNYQACVAAAVSDVFEEATVTQCADVARKLADYLLGATLVDPSQSYTLFGVPVQTPSDAGNLS